MCSLSEYCSFFRRINIFPTTPGVILEYFEQSCQGQLSTAVVVATLKTDKILHHFSFSENKIFLNFLSELMGQWSISEPNITHPPKTSTLYWKLSNLFICWVLLRALVYLKSAISRIQDSPFLRIHRLKSFLSVFNKQAGIPAANLTD